MTTWIKIGLVAVGLGGGLVAGWQTAAPAKCFYCPSYPCYGSCGGQCSCMQRGPGGGECVSFGRVKEYEAHGYTAMQGR